jgi:hypothetical protein
MQTVTKLSSTTGLSANTSTPVFGQAVILTVTVAPASAPGNVKFYQGTTLLGSATLVNGQAAFSWTPGAAGSTSASASYDGNTNFNASSSSAVAVSVQKASSSTLLASSMNPSVAGTQVTFTATVSPATVGGTVVFTSVGPSGTITLGSVAPVNGVASITSSALPSGVSNVTAQYGGSGNYNASSSTPLSQTVKVATTIAVTASPTSSTYGQSVTLRGSVSPSSATGTVQFFQAGSFLGTASVSGGIAILTTAVLPAGTLSLTASYSGDASRASSNSPVKSFVVAKANATAALSANPSTSRSGQSVTFTATVSPVTASGTMDFMDGNVVIANLALSNGVATFTTSSLSVATHTMRAVYSGDNNHNSDPSSNLNFRVKP